MGGTTGGEQRDQHSEAKHKTSQKKQNEKKTIKTPKIKTQKLNNLTISNITPKKELITRKDERVHNNYKKKYANRQPEEL